MYLVALTSASVLVAQVFAYPGVSRRQNAPTSLPPGWTGSFCFEDNRSFGFPLFTGAYFVDTTGMTIEKCLGFCDSPSQSFRFAGLTDGFQCSCDNFYEFILESVGTNECDAPCRGNPSEQGGCGGDTRASIYQNSNATVIIPALVESTGQWKTLGCYNDSTSARALHARVDAGNTTVESCVAACQAQGLSLAGLEFGRECWCGSELQNGAEPFDNDNGIQFGEFREDPDAVLCNLGCQGDPTELCGGPGLLDLYNFTGTFPVGASVVPFVDAWISQGCYSDSTPSRTLERRVSAGNVTVESCVNECQRESFTVAGLEFAQECWCGNQISAPGAPISQESCNQACVGNNTEVCGGPNALELYLFQNSPQVIGDLQELNGLSESLAGFLDNITASNVQTTGPEALVGLQGIINTVGMTQSNASAATNDGQSPFSSNNVDLVVSKLQSYVSFGTQLSDAFIAASAALRPSFQDESLEGIDMISFLADSAVPSRAGDTLHHEGECPPPPLLGVLLPTPCAPQVLAILYNGFQAAKAEPRLLGTVENELGLRKYLESLGHEYIVTSSKEGPDSDFQKHIVDTDILITTPFHPGYLTKDLMAKAKNLKLCVTAGVGSDHIDLDAAVDRKVQVLEVTGSNVTSVAEQVMMSILLLVRNFVPAHEMAARGDWQVSDIARGAFDLEGKVVGTLGAGRIGRLVLERLVPFNCKELLYYDYNALPAAEQDTVHARRVANVEELVAQCDVVTINAPLHDGTRGLINQAMLAKFKPGAWLVNTARGAICIAEDVAAAVRSGQLAGYAGDVWDVQPAPRTHPWRAMQNPLGGGNGMTPHYSGTTLDAQARYAEGTRQILENFFEGKAQKPADIIVGEGKYETRSYGEHPHGH
ncbi:hypothetical protein BC834DRAFT_971278 [Gloeopeniophorella convolvens]|nr:hypothetical protein BC834DRAFT_971278 [Gloeopeniophorella convolvens]